MEDHIWENNFFHPLEKEKYQIISALKWMEENQSHVNKKFKDMVVFIKKMMEKTMDASNTLQVMLEEKITKSMKKVESLKG